MYDFYLGGKNNFQADREARIWPGWKCRSPSPRSPENFPTWPWPTPPERSPGPRRAWSGPGTTFVTW